MNLGKSLRSVKPGDVESVVSSYYVGLFGLIRKALKNPLVKVVVIAIFIPFVLMFFVAVWLITSVFYHIFIIPK